MSLRPIACISPHNRRFLEYLARISICFVHCAHHRIPIYEIVQIRKSVCKRRINLHGNFRFLVNISIFRCLGEPTAFLRTCGEGLNTSTFAIFICSYCLHIQIPAIFHQILGRIIKNATFGYIIERIIVKRNTRILHERCIFIYIRCIATADMVTSCIRREQSTVEIIPSRNRTTVVRNFIKYRRKCIVIRQRRLVVKHKSAKLIFAVYG